VILGFPPPASVFYAELGARPALAPLLTVVPCGSHRLRLIRLSLRTASLTVAAVLGALARPAPLPIGRWPRTMAEADGSVLVVPTGVTSARTPVKVGIFEYLVPLPCHGLARRYVRSSAAPPRPLYSGGTDARPEPR
jgi:hypothetical protein